MSNEQERMITEALNPTAEEVDQQITKLKADTDELSRLVKDRNIEGVKSLVAFLDMDSKDVAAALELLPPDVNREALATRYLILKTKIDAVQESLVLATITPQPIIIRETAETSGNPASMKVKSIELPTYNGNLREWGAWWELYRIAVHGNQQYDDTTKHAHLKLALKGDAKKALEGLETKGTNYQTAVDELQRQFGDPTKLTALYYDDLAQMPTSHEASGQRSTLSNIKKVLKNLESLGSKTDQDNLKSTILGKFSKDTIRWALWQLLGGFAVDKSYTIAQLVEAIDNAVNLEERIDMYYARGVNKPTQSNTNNSSNSARPNPPTVALMTIGSGGDSDRKKCIFCNETSHRPLECGNFPTKDKRLEKLTQLSVCFLCTSNRHKANDCSLKNAPCPHCSRPGHQKILCATYLKEKREKYLRDKSSSGTQQHGSTTRRSGTFMETFHCFIKSQNRYVKVRGIIDTGSENSYVEDSLIQTLKLSKKVTNREAIQTGIFGKSTPEFVYSGKIMLTVSNIEKTVEKTLYYNTTPTITGPFRTSPSPEAASVVLPKHLKYADEGIFTDVWEPIQILIGCNFAQYEFLLNEIIKLPTPRVSIKNSIFGWIPSGELLSVTEQPTASTSALVCASLDEEENSTPEIVIEPDELSKLWSLEAIGIRSSETEDPNDFVIENFRKTTRFENNRFIVRWPWKHRSPKIPTNFQMCVARLKNLINPPSFKPRKNKPKIDLMKYDALIREQLRTGIIEKAPKEAKNATVVHYLPHRGIEKNGKLRIVHDASAKTSNNPCLNDLMYTGPVLTEDLARLLLNFRDNEIGLTADVEKAFLQLGLNEVDRDAARFLWVNDLSKPVTKSNLLFLRFARVFFGANASPFLLNMSLQELLSLAPTIECLIRSKRNFYIDNFVKSLKTLIEAVETHDALVQRFSSASLNLRDWKTNDKSVARALSLPVDDFHEKISVLGMLWNRESDTLSINYESKETPQNPTKRIVLSFLASIFDPLGLVSPCILPFKLLMQECWKIKLQWNDVLPPDLVAIWLKIRHEINSIGYIEFPRRLWNFSGEGTITLNIFCDASQDAYACAAYLTYVNQETRKYASTLIFSKARVAPISPKITIPNLELLATLIGKRTSIFLKERLEVNLNRVVLWTDATTVLQWLNSSEVLPKFVQNRVSEIKRTPNLTICYVPTKENPADIASRGMPPSNLKECTLWREGPSWLPHEKLWPTPPENTTTVSTAVVLLSNTPKYVGYLSDPFEKRLSSWDAYVKVIRGFMLLFAPSIRQIPTALTFSIAERKLILEIQKKYFPYELAMLKYREKQKEKANKEVKGNKEGKPTKKPTEKMILDQKLNLFLDKEGIIRCKGRIENAAFPWDAINPILLPKDSPLTKLYIMKIHDENLHVGTSHTLSKVRERVWIPKGRALVKYVLHRCTTCRRIEGGSYQPPDMPPLPNVRVTTDAPFMYSGVDYLGPMYILNDSEQVVKVYVVIFVCLVTRAIHLEAATDQSANKFFMALERFAGRRGCPKFLISDNAANFVFVQPLVGKTVSTSNIKLKKFLSDNVVQWKFIPSYSPWNGGAYERLVALVKSCLKKCYRIDYLSYDEFVTALVKIEKILNGRPLTYNSDEVLRPLTPNNILLPSRTANVDDMLEVNENKLDSSRSTLLPSYKRTNSAVENFWSLFRSHYLLSLREQHTTKHPTKKNSLPYSPRKGEVVLVKEPSAPRACWKLGIIHKLDKPQRVAEVKCNGRILSKPINHLFPLELPEVPKDDSAAPSAKRPRQK